MPDLKAGPQPESIAAPARRPLRRETVLLAVCVLLLLLATVPPLINLGRFQRRIAGVISRSIGRPVGMDSISLRLLPWPAFQITNLSVSEDPRFGAEPALRAPQVVAEPRLSSLWRGRFELSRVELTDASVNLVRNPDGRWNISSVLLQASHVPNAPTSQSHPGPAPRFPYIQATGTRINFKRGNEKLPFSLLDADFSMWLARPEVWRIQLEGQPVRTDLELALSDTGLVHLEGELHRASALGAMPLQLTGEWSHAPLGQLSRLLLGRDASWRGDIDLSAGIQGEIDHLDLSTHLKIANLHREEFTPEQPFTLDATCRAHYSRAQPALNSLACRWPVGDGSLLLTHEPAPPGLPQAAPLPTPPQDMSLTLAADKVPAGFFAAALGLLRPGAPNPRRFTGALSGSFSYLPAETRLTGAVAAPELSIAGAAADDSPLVLRDVLLAAGAGPSLLLTSRPLALGVPGRPLALSAELSLAGYSLHANGGGMLSALDAAASALDLPGLPHLSSLAEAPATAQMALTRSGPWLGSGLGSGLSPGGDTAGNTPVTGSVHLENARWEPPWLLSPVDLLSADVALSPGTIRWSTPAAILGTGATRLRFAGNAQAPPHCDELQTEGLQTAGPPTAQPVAMPTACGVHFSLGTAALDAAALQAALTGGRQPLLTALLDRIDSSRIHLPALAGSLHAGLLTLGKLPVRDVSVVLATVNSAHSGPSIAIQSLDGEALGGSLHLQGAITLAGGGPRYVLQAALSGASATQAAALWHENWGPGTLGGTAELSLAGSTAQQLLGSVKGSFHASWLHGDLPPALPDFASWDASGSFSSSGLTLDSSTLSGTPATLSGSIGWDRTLALALTPAPGEPPTTITGTLAAPLAAPVSTAATP